MSGSVDPKRPAPVPNGYVARNAAFLVCGAALQRESPVRTPHRLHGNLVRNEVDDAPESVAPIQERGGTTHDLDLGGGGGIERHPVVGGLARQVAGARPVLQDEHPITVQASHDGARGTWAERADVHARLGPQRLAETSPQAGLQIFAAQHAGGLVRLEGVAASGPDRHRLGEVDGRGEGQHCLRSGGVLQRDLAPGSAKAFSACADVIGPGRYVFEAADPIRPRCRFTGDLNQGDQGAGESATRFVHDLDGEDGGGERGTGGEGEEGGGADHQAAPRRYGHQAEHEYLDPRKDVPRSAGPPDKEPLR